MTRQNLMRPGSDFDGQSLSFFQAVQVIFVLVPLELSLYGFPTPWEAGRIAVALVATPWSSVLAVAGACGLVNAYLLAGKLRRETPAGTDVRPWLRASMLTIGCLPVVWLSALNGWAWVRARRPGWALRARTSSQILELRSGRRLATTWPSRPELGRRFSFEALKFGWLVVANGIALLLVGLRLCLSPDPTSRQATLWAAISAHVLIFIDLVHFQSEDNQRYGILGRRRNVKLTLPVCCLLPLPMVMAYFVFMLDDRLLDSRASTVTTRAYRNRQSLDRLPLWRSLETTLDAKSPWRRIRQRLAKNVIQTRERGATGERRRKLHALATILLAGDSLALGWLLGSTLPPGAVDGLLGAALWLCLGAASAGYLLALAMAALRAADLARGRAHVYGSPLAAGQLTLLAGLTAGALLGQGRLRDGGILMALACAAAAMVYVLTKFSGDLIAGASPMDSGIIVWPGILFTMVLVGLTIALDDSLAYLLEGIVIGLALLSPLWHALLAARFAGSLIHPFDVRRLRQYPRTMRLVLGLLVASLILPMGGLVLPYWIYARRRHWPEYVRRALGESQP